jgi:hypothetical protein
METIFSKSVEERSINLIINGVDPIEAVKQAIQAEQKLIEEMISQTTERSKNVKNKMCKDTYHLINIFM